MNLENKLARMDRNQGWEGDKNTGGERVIRIYYIHVQNFQITKATNKICRDSKMQFYRDVWHVSKSLASSVLAYLRILSPISKEILLPWASTSNDPFSIPLQTNMLLLCINLLFFWFPDFPINELTWRAIFCEWLLLRSMLSGAFHCAALTICHSFFIYSEYLVFGGIAW